MDFDKFSDDLDANNAFWAAEGRADTYNLEPCGRAYMQYEAMVKQDPSPYYQGDWVRSEDYRAHVEALETTISALKQCPIGECAFCGKEAPLKTIIDRHCADVGYSQVCAWGCE